MSPAVSSGQERGLLSRTVAGNRAYLILGEVFYISIIYRIPDSWLYSLNGYDFSCDHMTGENRELKGFDFIFRSISRRIRRSSHNALRLNYIIVFSITWPFICYGFHRSRVANRSGISRKKAYLSPLLRSWSTGKCSVRTIYLSSSEVSSWPRQFPWENRRTKDVRVFISEESGRCSEGSPISSPFGSDKQLWYQGELLSVSFLGFWFGIWL